MTNRQTRKQKDIIEKKVIEACPIEGEAINGFTFYIVPFLPERFVEWKALKVYANISFDPTWSVKHIDNVVLGDDPVAPTISHTVNGPYNPVADELEITFDFSSVVKLPTIKNINELYLVFDLDYQNLVPGNDSTLNSLVLDMSYLVEQAE